MRELLQSTGVQLSPYWSNRTTYHLEVKATPSEQSAPFFVSANQIRMVRYKTAVCRDVALTCHRCESTNKALTTRISSFAYLKSRERARAYNFFLTLGP
jgi:hypothetical protein